MKRRRTAARVIELNAPVLERIRAIKADHPFWGYRRVWAHLRYVDRLDVNNKRVYRLMKLHGLTVSANTRLKARRTPGRDKPRPTRPNPWWGIDMTKILTRRGWVQVVIVLDWHSKKFVGWHAGRRATSRDWLAALERACDRQFPVTGIRGQGVALMSDNGCQPTSLAFMRACRTLGIKQAFTSYGNPKGNADTERSIRTLKEELLWLREWKDEHEVAEAIDQWMPRFNEQYLHSALGYKSPNAFENQHGAGPNALLNVA